MKLLDADVQVIALSLWEELDCARSLTCTIMVRYSEWDQLITLKVDPKHHNTSDSYFRAAQATDFLRKFEEIPADCSANRESTSFEKWLWAEKECFKTNRRLNELRDFGTLNGVPVAQPIHSFVERVRKNVRYLIGDQPPDIIEGAFGPGATVSDSYGKTTICHKLSSVPTFSPDAWPYLIPFIGNGWGRCASATKSVPISVRGDTYFTVKKDASVFRTCAKSPSINVFYQLGYGQVMRRRLKRRFIDLDEGKAIHMQVACDASVSGEYCTIDLTSASDLVSTSLVELVSPPKWLAPLSDLRSKYTFAPKFGGSSERKWYRLEKFSAMGNGYTFELETTLFAAITMAVDPSLQPGVNMWVYGDDIIAPSHLYNDIISALKFFGFVPNPRKCFHEGNFRESCGGDYFNGDPVRAHYLKEPLNEPQDYISLANGVRRAFNQSTRLSFIHNRPCRTWFRILDRIPTPIRQCRGPEELGDLCINDSEREWRFRWRGSIRWVRVYRPCSFTGVGFDRFGPETQMQAALYGVSLMQLRRKSSVDNRTVIGRDAVVGYKVGWTPFS